VESEPALMVWLSSTRHDLNGLGRAAPVRVRVRVACVAVLLDQVEKILVARAGIRWKLCYVPGPKA
jgi:hypothetical protein